MKDESLGRPRRSTRAPKSDAPSSHGTTEKNETGSRLAGGVRKQPGASNRSNTGAKSDAPSALTQAKPKSDTPSSGVNSANTQARRPNDVNQKGNQSNKTDHSDKEENDKTSNKEQNKTDESTSSQASQQETDKDGSKEERDESQSNDAPSKNEGGLADKVKNASSNATNIDYSDKGKKDQLEHQAADVAMDATPVLSQFNSARRALKDVNKAKREMGGGNDGITDKAEEKMDDAVDKGIKGVKYTAGAGAVGGIGALGVAGLMMMKMFMMLKGFAMAVIGKIAGFIGSVVGAVSSFVSGALGVTAAVGNAIVAGVTAVTVAGAGILGVGVVQEVTKKDDSLAACTPDQTSVSESSQSYLEDGDIDAIREGNAVKLWSVYDEIGGSKEQTAAVLGNLQAESSLDPTAVETIYDEPFSIGPRKQSAMDVDFQVELIDADYAAEYGAIEHVGIGLAQWTNGRNRLLLDYANDNGVNWYDFDTQVRFMLDGDQSYRQDQLSDFLTTDPSNVQTETERFMNTWIGLSSPNPSLGARQTNATDYMFILERATADTDYADSILSGINVNHSEGNNAAGAYYQDDGCGNPIKTHYNNQSVDGTGQVPSDLALVPWSRETLPESLHEYAKNPEDAGLAWGNALGWANNIYADQCAALSHSYFMRLYPGWNQDDRSSSRPTGDGKDVADRWANHYGESTVDYPASGAVFSDTTTSIYGHTGIVQHVFANGDILINEQNIRGVSGAGANISYSWSWRVIKKDRYEQENWIFFKPAGAQPQWESINI